MLNGLVTTSRLRNL